MSFSFFSSQLCQKTNNLDILLCRELVGVMRKYWYLESVHFEECNEESAVDDHVQCDVMYYIRSFLETDVVAHLV